MRERNVDNAEFTKFLERLEKTDKDPLMRESDRGCVLARAADIENQLQALLAGWFTTVGETSRREEKLLFDFTGPVGTFSAKIMLSRAMGLISKELYGDLQRLRALRNLAAHTTADFSLSSKEARSLVAGMHYEYGKMRSIPRYSLRPHEVSDGSEQKPEPNESVMKGFGYIRYDKSNFIMTMSFLEIHLTSAATKGSVIASGLVRDREIMHEALKNSDAATGKGIE